MTSPTRRRGLAMGAATALLAITGAACSGSPDSDSDSASGSTSGGDTSLVTAEKPAQDAAASVVSDSDTGGGTSQDKGDAPAQPKVISTGEVQLRSKDVGDAIDGVRKVVDAHRGVIQEDTNRTDDDGRPLAGTMVIRVPASAFEDTMDDLEGVATLIASSSSGEDVTTTVLDNEVRLQVQKRSIRRISVLLDRATTIRDVVSIESQLSQRQADLASLEQQQRYLADQTTMSTINVSVERSRRGAAAPQETDHTGFLPGLAAGWSGLKSFGVGVATVLGALLPWMVLLAILAVPGWPLLRRLRRRIEGPAAPA